MSLPSPRGNAANVHVGPGAIYVAVLGTSEPTSITSSLDAAWKAVGYTDDGSQLVVTPSFQDVNVAEELDPIIVAPVSRTIAFDFTFAEVTAPHLKAALNGGVDTSATLAEPVDLGSETRIMILHDSENGERRTIIRRAIETGAVTIVAKKAPAKSTITASYRLEKPSGAKAFTVLFT